MYVLGLGAAFFVFLDVPTRVNATCGFVNPCAVNAATHVWWRARQRDANKGPPDVLAARPAAGSSTKGPGRPSQPAVPALLAVAKRTGALPRVGICRDWRLWERAGPLRVNPTLRVISRTFCRRMQQCDRSLGEYGGRRVGHTTRSERGTRRPRLCRGRGGPAGGCAIEGAI